MTVCRVSSRDPAVTAQLCVSQRQQSATVVSSALGVFTRTADREPLNLLGIKTNL